MNNYTLSIDSDKFEKNFNEYLKVSKRKLYINLSFLLLCSTIFILLSYKIIILQHIVVRILWALIILRALFQTIYMNSFIDSIQKKKEKLVNKIKHSHTSFSVNTVSKSKEDLYKNIIEGLRENIQILVKSSNSTNITTTFNYKSKSLEYSSSSALSFEMHRSYIRITDTNNILVVDLPIVRSNYEALQPLSILLKSIKIS